MWIRFLHQQREEVLGVVSLTLLYWYLTFLSNWNPYYAYEDEEGHNENRRGRIPLADWARKKWWRNGTAIVDEQLDHHFHFYLFNEEYGDYLPFDPKNKSSFGQVKVIPNVTWYLSQHGYLMHYDSGPIVKAIAQELKARPRPCNILATDYRKLMQPPHYTDNVMNVNYISEKMADTVHALIQKKVARPEDIHCVGYSLGSTICGGIGMFIQQKYGMTIGRITGLCPAGIKVEFFAERDNALDRTDAAFVEIFHAAGKYLGVWKPVGHVDYYINGGAPTQPGCPWSEFRYYYLCSHGMAELVWFRAITKTFTAIRCDSWENFDRGHCNWTGICHYSHNQPRCTDGVYYLVAKRSDLFG